MRIELPWPDKRLSPNARLHWAAKSPVKALAREDARKVTFGAMQKHLATQAHFEGDDPLPMTVKFYPPDRRHRDDDNMIGAFKAARDGIADALGVNDRRFRPSYEFCEPEKRGRVEVTFPLLSTPAEPSECSPSVLDNRRPGSGAETPSGPDQNHPDLEGE